MSTLDARKNFSVADLSQGYSSAATSVDVATGKGAKFPDPATAGAYNLVWWNYTDYKNPSDDPDVEIVRCTARTSDTLTLTRAQETTTASAKDISGKTYKIMLAPTAKMITDIETALDSKIASTEKGSANGVATLDAGGQIPTGQLPALAITDTFVVASQAAMLALTAETGDVAIRTDLNKSFILASSPASTLSNWKELLTPTDTVLSVNGQTGAVTLTTTNISEGANLYFTNARAVTALTGQNISIFVNNVPYAALASAITLGSILYADVNGKIAEDNQNLYWDSVSKKVYILSTIGSEQVSNGTFTGSASSWSVPSGWAYSSNTVVHNSNGTGNLSQNVNVTAGKAYQVTYTVSALTVGTVTPQLGGVNLTTRSANGTYTERVVVTSNGSLLFQPTNTARFTLDNISVKELTGGSLRTGGIDINLGSNSQPGQSITNQSHVRLHNSSGSYSLIDAWFSGSFKGAISFDSGGSISIMAQNGAIRFLANSSFTYMGYMNATLFYHYGYIASSNGVVAGGSYPYAMLQSAGSFGTPVEYVATDYTLSRSNKNILVNAADNDHCAGTATTACSTYTNQTDCQLRSSHGGCTWNTHACSDYNYTNQSSCESGHSGCTWDSVSCAGPGDQYSCESQDDSYGGSCSWVSCSGYSDSGSCTGAGCTWNYSDCSIYNGQQGSCQGTSGCTYETADCSAFNNNEGACTGNMCSWTPSYDGDCGAYNNNEGACTGTSGCSWNNPDCASYNGDQGSCEGAGCYWDGMGNCYGKCSGSYYQGNGSCSGSYYTGTCSGQYNTSCSGDHCTGNYYTGSCSGAWYDCTGTPSCAGIGTETPCGEEAGCSWSAGVNIRFPAIDNTTIYEFSIKKVGAGGTLTCVPLGSGDTIEGASTYPWTADKEAHTFVPKIITANCSAYNAAESTCGSTSGCTQNYTNCGSYGDESSCTGDAHCSWNGMSCDGGSYFSSCSGSYTISKNWYIMSSN